MVPDMQRRTTYACAGGLLSIGAQLGLLALRTLRERSGRGRALRRAIREVARNRDDYVYVGASTALVLSAFGFILGCQADQLRRLSRTDALTGLLNARGLFERLDVELARARRYGGSLAMLVIDLDGLKRINDRYGHRAGDEALRSLADVIRSQLRDTDVGARWGGDEFAVLAPGTSRSAALDLAERVRSLILQRKAGWPLSASIGVATIDAASSPDERTADRLMHDADRAMYEAKRRGRNKVVAVPWR